MNRALIWWTAGIIVLMLIVAWGFSRADREDPEGIGALPWIEVVSDDVTVEGADDGESFVAQTGDELPDGAVVTTNASGAARIHFPDGSFARLDPRSSLTVSHVSFDPDDSELIVRLKLARGSVWSKVVSLATRGSSWEVETSQAVAAVRGTAFGVTANDEGTKTRVIGIEDNVAVTGDKEKIVAPETELNVINGVISPLLALSEETRNDESYRSFLDEDKSFNRMLDEIRGAYRSEREWRRALRQQKIEMFRGNIRDIRQDRDEPQPSADDALLETIDEENGSNPAEVPAIPVSTETGFPVISNQTIETKTTRSGGSSGGRTTSASTYTKIEVIPASVDELIEGDRIDFKAFLISTSGDRIDITNEATWGVVGDIGLFERPGTFKASLKPDLREYGVRPGGISATYKDISTQQTFEGVSGPFDVRVKIEPNPVVEG